MKIQQPHPHQIRYEATRIMRVMNPRGVFRIKSQDDQSSWTRIGPRLRMQIRSTIKKAKETRGTTAWFMEMAILPPRPKHKSGASK